MSTKLWGIVLGIALVFLILSIKSEVKFRKEKTAIETEIEKTVEEILTENKQLKETLREERINSMYVGFFPEHNAFNEKFAALYDLLEMPVPYIFVPAQIYKQSAINENFDVITEALRKKLSDKTNFRFKELALLVATFTGEAINIKFTTERNKEFYTADDIEHNLDIFIEALQKELSKKGEK